MRPIHQALKWGAPPPISIKGLRRSDARGARLNG